MTTIWALRMIFPGCWGDGGCVALPWETAGPFPGDGTNSRRGQTVNVLTQEGVIRSDLRPSFGDLTQPSDGLRFDLDMTLVAADGCTPLADLAIYVWHCDASGDYSLYNVEGANWLRGVGISAADGKVSFVTQFPGCYAGRWPHIHFEVFSSIEEAVSGAASALTAQIALPQEACITIYTSDARYPTSARNFSGMSLSSDNIFADNSPDQIAQQTAQVTGTVEDGFQGSVTIPIAL